MPTNNKQQLLDQIRADIITKNVCPDLAKQAKNLVMGDGNIDAEVVFIGEAPGKNEDEQGLPFVGAAGKFLNEMLVSIGLERSDVYITNIVKYRPPNNRDPLPEEKKAFWQYLVRQLEVIEPKIVITLGRHSMEYFLPGMQITAIHGQPKRIHFVGSAGWENDQGAGSMQGNGEQRTEVRLQRSEGAAEPLTKQSTAIDGGTAGFAGRQAIESLVIIPLYHPAAALYNGGLRQTLLDDFQVIPATLRQIK